MGGFRLRQKEKTPGIALPAAPGNGRGQESGSSRSRCLRPAGKHHCSGHPALPDLLRCVKCGVSWDPYLQCPSVSAPTLPFPAATRPSAAGSAWGRGSRHRLRQSRPPCGAWLRPQQSSKTRTLTRVFLFIFCKLIFRQLHQS